MKRPSKGAIPELPWKVFPTTSPDGVPYAVGMGEIEMPMTDDDTAMIVLGPEEAAGVAEALTTVAREAGDSPQCHE